MRNVEYMLKRREEDWSRVYKLIRSMSPHLEYKVSLVSLAAAAPFQMCARWGRWGQGMHSHGHCSVQGGGGESPGR